MAVDVIDAGTSATPQVVEFPDSTQDELVNAARLAITDGILGCQTFSEVGQSAPHHRARAVSVAGLYGPAPEAGLLTGPAWTPSGWRGDGQRWALDLCTGTVAHRIRTDAGEVSTRRWSAAGRPGVQVFSAPLGSWSAVDLDRSPAEIFRGSAGDAAALAVEQYVADEVVTSVAVVRAGDDAPALVREARAAAASLSASGWQQLAREQQLAWSTRWRDCHVSIVGDALADQRSNYALYQLLSLSDCGDELPLGARGLTGPAYRGHVFWDTDVFVLPSLAMVAPGPARAVIEYRLRRLGAARAAAASDGLLGARFPWESAAEGSEVTPRWARAPSGERVRIRTGEQELHITADICWSIDQYVQWTGDESVLEQGAAELIGDAARFWASRTTADERGEGHVSGVIGPDEYHENIDDNAFTNQMAAWNLRVAAALADEGRIVVGGGDVANRWRDLAAAMSVECTEHGHHEQFVGYDDLEPVLAGSIATPPFAGDLLLSRAELQRSQLIKQPDVVMLHHMIPNALGPGSLVRDLGYYLPRTTHGSSLSPAIHAATLARAGRADEALHWYHIALAIDLDDLTGTGVGGLHYATLGGAWQALLWGFLGVRPGVGGALLVDPCLPKVWDRVEVAFYFRGAAVVVQTDGGVVDVHASEPVVFTRPDGGPLGRSRLLHLERRGGEWVRT